MSSSLTFNKISSFRCKSTTENVIYLTWNTSERFCKILPAEKYRIPGIVLLQKFIDMGFDQFCQTLHIYPPQSFSLYIAILFAWSVLVKKTGKYFVRSSFQCRSSLFPAFISVPLRIRDMLDLC